MLRNLKVENTFLKAKNSDLIKTFYEPALKESILYQRGTAFFSIEFLLNLMDSLVDFVYRGGKVELITSVELDENTIRSFTNGYLLQDSDVVAELYAKLENYLANGAAKNQDEEARLDVIANMIAARRLVIKVAVTQNGIYHEKIGIFSDDDGDSIAFFGSANETLNAFYNNYETLTICSSWDNTASLIKEYRSHFTRLWENNEFGIQVIDFPKALESRLVGLFKKSQSLDVAINRLLQIRQLKSPVCIRKRTLHDYQEDAINEFIANNYCHMFEMATGTGKTFTAIKAIEKMALKQKYLNVIVLVPLVDLQRQWEKSINDDLDLPHRIYKFGGCGRDDARMFRLSTNTAACSHKEFVSIAICVYDTYFSGLYTQLKSFKGDTLIVVDEAHNLTTGNVDVLSNESRFKLGLSATPNRYSQHETKRLMSLFLPNDKLPYRYPLEKAIANGFLSKYDYFPLIVELTDDEHKRYEDESKRIAKLYNIYENDPTASNRKRMEDALMSRSRIVKKAANKIALLDSLVKSEFYDFHNSIVFCGPGKFIVDGVATQERIVDLVTKTIGCNSVKHYFPAKYTSGEIDRPARLEGFKQGLTDTLVAVKCFDEGLDVPALDKIYIMASDSSLRQTIQRRGRVLRISNETGKTIAHIYDMVTGYRIGNLFRPLPTELPRVYEYSRLSINPEASAPILAGYKPDIDTNAFDELENND